jgi:iron-sulfur cluster assembly accessory protein
MNITDNALKHLPAFNIRIKVKKGGCSGYELIMEEENSPRPQDIIIENLIIDPLSYDILKDKTIDYQDYGLQGHAFAVVGEDVNVCGCGKSFG